MHFSLEAIGPSYPDLIAQVLRRGHESAPRGAKIMEANPLTLELEDPTRCVVSRKGFNPSLMWLEIASLLAGEYHEDLYRLVASRVADMLSPQGAYGPRTRDQMPYVIEELKRDPDTRRAVVYVGRDTDLRYSSQFEQPCTMTWQFLIRGGRLNMIVNMRSWDLVWGLCYDIPCFVSVQLALAWALNIPVGTYTHMAGSGHIYERHWAPEAVAAKPNDEALPTMHGTFYQSVDHQVDFTPTDPLMRWLSLTRHAAQALVGLRSLLTSKNAGAEWPTQWGPAFKHWTKLRETIG